MDAHLFSCVRCGVVTSHHKSLGMWQCSYHPHVDGALKPFRAWHRSLAIVDTSDTGSCAVCHNAYAGFASPGNRGRGAGRGCTSVDHMPKGVNFAHVLTQKPYEVMPLERWKREPFLASVTPYHIIRGMRSQAQSNVHVVNSLAGVHDVHGRKMYLHVRFYAPRAADCGIKQRECALYDLGVVVSLMTLYNECADAYGYARIGESSWKKRILHENRYFIAKGGQESGGVAMMSADDVCVRELYADAERMIEHHEFHPFVVVLRVEPREVRITPEICLPPTESVSGEAQEITQS